MKTCFTVFHVDSEPGLRGGERQLLYLAAALGDRGHRNVIICRPGGLLEAEAKRLRLTTRPMAFKGEWDVSAARGLARLARQAANPVIHAHTAHAAAWAAIASFDGIPSVGHRRVDFKLSRFWPSHWKYRALDHVVGVSRAVQTLLVKGGVRSEKVSVIPDAIPADAEECRLAGAHPADFSPPSPETRALLRREFAEAFGIPEDRPWVGNLAALVPHKDHDTLLDAAAVVLSERPEVVFIIAGEGPLETELKDKALRLGLEDRAFFLGQVSRPMALLGALDIFCLSSWGEGMGSVLLEASACALPIAATTAGGISEIIEDGGSGLLCPPRDPGALAGNILRLLSNEGLRGRLGKAARASLGRFGLKETARRMEKVYERACAR